MRGDAARIFEAEPDVRHTRRRYERGRVLQERDEHFPPVRQLAGNERAAREPTKLRTDDAAWRPDAGNRVAGRAAVRAARDQCA